MASKTSATEFKRKRRDKSMGKKSKSARRTNGTTKTAKELFGDK
jgi:hypothetical protein